MTGMRSDTSPPSSGPQAAASVAGPADAAPDRLAGAPNFRAVAELPAAHGARLRALRLFRSDALHRLEGSDLDRLASLRIGTVLDLRREDERDAAPSRWPSHARPATRTFDAASDALAAVRAGGWRVLLVDAASLDAAAAHRWMLDTYARMPAALAPAVHAAIERLAADDAVLVHCTAGKDRTGFVVATVLEALGVPRDAIEADYLESGRRRPPESLARMLVEAAGLAPTGRLIGAVETIASVRPEFLDAALGVVAREHGSSAAYLRACGVDDAMLAGLRERMLAA
jgi:protein-tyrosine phosphatase